jgi:hypothetical protein
MPQASVSKSASIKKLTNAQPKKHIDLEYFMKPFLNMKAVDLPEYLPSCCPSSSNYMGAAYSLTLELSPLERRFRVTPQFEVEI